MMNMNAPSTSDQPRAEPHQVEQLELVLHLHICPAMDTLQMRLQDAGEGQRERHERHARAKIQKLHILSI